MEAHLMPVLTNIRNGLNRYTTQSYIADDPVSIVLERKVRVPKPGGGHDMIPHALDAQVFRMVSQTATDGQETSANDGGEVHKFTYIIVGAWDADVAEDDTWSEGNVQYHVDGVEPNNGYETRAYVTAFAQEPIHG
jgi:hypothetical protein